MLVRRALAEAPITETRVHLIAAGKASRKMAIAAIDTLGGRLQTRLQIGPVGSSSVPGIELVTGGHPIPTADSERAGRRALDVARGAARGDLLLVLLSGGSSALMAVPADDLHLEDKQAVTNVLLRAGAAIHALNTVRKHLSAIKGGWLAASSAASCRTLAISDVVGDDLSVIGSGPTVPDASTFADALSVLGRFDRDRACPVHVWNVLRAGASGARAETPKPGDPRFVEGSAVVIGGRHDAMRGAADAARARGYNVEVVEEAVTGDARTAATEYAARTAREGDGGRRPLAIVSSGETTVQVRGSGRGGRNQEFALALADPIARAGSSIAVLSLGTDGVDGPTDAAGAVVDSTTLVRARDAGLGAPVTFLNDNNSYMFFDAIGDLVRTGPTGTNVGDVQVALLG